MHIFTYILSAIFCLATPASLIAQTAWHFNASDVNALHASEANYRIYYGSDPLHFGDLRLPKGDGPYPVAIIIHGGCWISTFANLQNTNALSDALRNIGIATWNIEYRRIDNIGGGWPGTFLDIAQGADFLYEIANKYTLDLNHVIAIGHSAGGHLALWLAMRHKLPPTSELYASQPLLLNGVISLGGVPDLKIFRDQGQLICGEDVVGKLLGDSPDKISKHYSESSPIELLPLGISQVLIYGADDEAVPASFAKEYIKKARNEGDAVKLTTVEGAAHHEYNVPNSIAWPIIKASVLNLLSMKYDNI